jgi:uncharacterized protein (TIGR03032 family)
MSGSSAQIISLHYYDLDPSPGLAGWLAAKRVSLAFSTGEDVFLVGVGPSGQLSVFSTEIERCTALTAVDSDTLYLATRYQIWRLVNAVPRGELAEERYDRLYIPQSAHTTGNLSVQGIGVESDGRVLFVNTPFNCIAALDERKNFQPLWLPPWVTELAMGDRCHLNGVALRDGAAAYATSLSRSNQPDGWRADRLDGGVVVDLASNEIIATGLSMPHTPRWYRDRLWVTSAGTGEFGYIDLERGNFEVVASCPGFVRGLAFIGDYAVVGASKPRHGNMYAGLDLDDILARRGHVARSGLFIIDLRSGSVVEHLSLFGSRVREVLDIAALEDVTRPSMLQLGGEMIQQTVMIGPTQPL